MSFRHAGLEVEDALHEVVHEGWAVFITLEGGLRHEFIGEVCNRHGQRNGGILAGRYVELIVTSPVELVQHLDVVVLNVRCFYNLGVMCDKRHLIEFRCQPTKIEEISPK